MKVSITDIIVLAACFSLPLLFLVYLHLFDPPYFMPLKNSSDGQLWLVLVAGELFFLISRFIRKQ